MIPGRNINDDDDDDVDDDDDDDDESFQRLIKGLSG